MTRLTIFISFILFFFASCNKQKSGAETFEELKEILPANARGVSFVGEVMGESSFTFKNDNSVSVTYTALENSATEIGSLENFKLKNSPDDNCFLLEADWKNMDASSGSGIFQIKNNESQSTNSVLIQIMGSGWRYTATINLLDESFRKFKEIMKNSSNKVPVQNIIENENSEPNISSGDSNIKEINKPEQNNVTNRKAVIQNINLSDLCGKVYYSKTFGVLEVLSFEPDKYGCKLLYSSPKYPNQSLQYSNNIIWFTKKPLEKYTLENLSEDGQRFDLINPNGTTQTYRANVKPQINGKYPEASQRLLTDSDLNSLSKQDLKIMRNEIYARYGRIFKNSTLKNYFENQEWYEGKYEDVSSMLSDMENSNVKLILRYEME